MRRHEDPGVRLEALGASRTAQPSVDLLATFTADRLELRPRAASPRAVTASRHVLPRLPRLVAAGALAFCAVLAFLVVDLRSDHQAPVVVLSSSFGYSVEIDGRALDAVPGQVLPESAVVVVGSDGIVTAGGMTLGPDEVAVVHQGQLRRIEA